MEEECWITNGIVPELDRVPFLQDDLFWQSSVPSARFCLSSVPSGNDFDFRVPFLLHDFIWQSSVPSGDDFIWQSSVPSARF